MEEEKDQFAGLSAAQKKKLKTKLKAEKEAAGTDQPEAEKAPATTEAVPEEDKDDKDDQFAGLSQAQKKKLKAKLKAEADAKAAGTEVKAELDDEDAGAKGAKGKKAKKGKNSAIADKIRKQQEERAKEQEELDRLQREEEERIAKIEAEEKRIADAAKEKARLKKQAKTDKINAMKAAGTYLTPAQQAQREAALARRRAMEESGLVPRQEEEDAADGDDNKKTSMVKRDRKKNKKQDAAKDTTDQKEVEKVEAAQDSGEEDDFEGHAQQKQADAKATKKELAAQEDDGVEFDDWENAIEDIATTIVKKTADTVQSGANLDESDDSNSEEETKEQRTEKVASKAATKKEAKKEDKGSSLFSNVAEDPEARKKRLAQRRAELEAKRLEGKKKRNLRCPIICILGHVDTGKTLILDKLRRTNVQAGEAGGITQQIGATYFPGENLQKHLDVVAERQPFNLEIPGFLVIDTPGHESFTNLRSRGSSLCDMAVLVVDIMHGLEPQTKESIQLLRQKNTPFCIALNKIDRLNQWKAMPEGNTRDTLDSQNSAAKQHFQTQLEKTMLAFAELGLNVINYWENQSVEDTFSLVPTSAITGEGLSDLMYYLCNMGQTAEREKLTEKDAFECTVLEVKIIEGHGTTIDVVLTNGLLKVGDTIVISGMNGPIETNIRALLTPQPMKELRVKGEYVHHQKIKGAMGIKISAPGLESAIAGSELFKCVNDQEIEDAKEQIERDLIDILDKYVDKTQDGVCVQASTIGSLEALLEFLKCSKIPVANVNIGPIHRKDVIKATTAMNKERAKIEFATILAFDVRVMPDAAKFAEEEGIKIFTANIIYHLFDEFTAYVQKCKDDRKAEDGNKAIFPCIIEMVKDACFNTKSPIVIGVNVKEGVLRTGTPICVPDKGNLRLGTVQSIELNKKPVNQARTKDGSVAIKIVNDGSVMYGRQFDDKNQIVSLVTRDSIDLLKENYRDEMTKDDWVCVMKLKKIFGIM